MPHVVAHLLKLVEDPYVFSCSSELVSLVEDLLHVGLCSRCCDHFAGNVLEPVESLAAHALRQDRYGINAEECAVECAASAVVACRRPYSLVIACIELTCYEFRNEAAVGSSYLVAACREPLADHADDAALYSCQFRREHDVVRSVEESAGFLLLVLPCDTEEVYRIDVPEPGVLQLRKDLFRNLFRMHLLIDGRQDDVLSLCTLDVVLKALFIDGEIKHFVPPLILVKKFLFQM